MAEVIKYKPVRWTAPDGDIWERSGDCLRCGDCCSDILIGFDESDQETANFYQLHLGGILTKKAGQPGIRLLVHAPCQALNHNQCVIYDTRPKLCREWPLFPGPNPNCGFKWTKVVEDGV